MSLEIERIPVGDSLEVKYNQLKKDYDSLVNKQYQSSYTIENQKKRIEDIGKTLNLYERENKALRELIAYGFNMAANT
jgi:division protein CdvB (Snf7/Vps24/ESCRT-III family)